MPPFWFISTSVVVLNAASVVGIVLVVLGLLGREDLSHPRCRRCGHDLRPLAWAWAGDAAASGRRRAACPACGRALTRRGVRWRPYHVAWRAVGLGAALLIASMGVLAWGVARANRGLTWRDLVPVAFDLRTIEAVGYPGQASPWNMNKGDWQLRTWQSDPWMSLNRRAAAGELTIEELAAAAHVVDRAARNSNTATAIVRSRGSTAPHADLLIEILGGDLDPALRGSAAKMLVSAPDLFVEVDGQPLLDSTVDPGQRLVLRLRTDRHAELWGDHSQTVRWTPRRRRLDALCFVQEVLLDGVSIPFTVERAQRRSGAFGWHRYDGPFDTCVMPTVGCAVEVGAGKHEIAVVLDMAVVDFGLAQALADGQGEPGPPPRWGARAVVRRETVSRTIVVAGSGGASLGAEPGEGGQP